MYILEAIWDFFSFYREKHIFYKTGTKHKLVLYVKRYKWEKSDDINKEILEKLGESWYFVKEYYYDI
jgi:hypothetical protein